MKNTPDTPELASIEGTSKREILLRIKACCDEELLTQLGLNKPLKNLNKKKKTKDVDEIKRRFLELASPDSLLLYEILAARQLPSLEEHDYPNRIVGGMVVSMQSTVRGHLARRRVGQLTAQRATAPTAVIKSKQPSPVSFQPISPNTVSPRLLPNIGQPLVALNLDTLEELVTRFASKTSLDAFSRPQLEPVVVEDAYSNDYEYLLDKLEAKQRRLQGTLMNLASVYKKRVDVYNEYQHTYSALAAHGATAAVDSYN